MVEYISTRGKATKLGFIDAAIAGMASDGGLYVPETLPLLVLDDIEEIAQSHYKAVAKKIIPLFIGNEISKETISSIIDKSYAGFQSSDVIDMVQFEDNFHLMELFHGQTLAFKDIALQFLGNVFEEILKNRSQKINILGATSGDTGSAAINAFKGKDNVNIFIMHPEGRVSDIQRKQMTTVADKNVFNIAVKGSFDDCQNIVKDLFADEEFRNKVNLSAVNSINWARILAQTVYYIYASCKFYNDYKKRVTFSVPTGNFGNVYAGYIAKKMGAPIDKLIVATNKNDILHRFFASGEMKIEKSSLSLSPSMDIQVSSNFERLLFELSNRDADKVTSLMKELKEKGRFKVDNLKDFQKIFSSGSIDDDMIVRMISEIYRQYNYIIDPHGAVGLGVAEDYLEQNPNSIIISLATAHPAKFPDVINKAIGINPEVPARLSTVFDKEEHFVVKNNSAKEIKEYMESVI